MYHCGYQNERPGIKKKLNIQVYFNKTFLNFGIKRKYFKKLHNEFGQLKIKANAFCDQHIFLKFF
jgi:hypothetical protein